MYTLEYKIIINLQKAVDNKTTYIDIKKLSKEIITKNMIFEPIKIIKFNNLLGTAIINREDGYVAIAVLYEIEELDSKIVCNDKIIYWDNRSPIFKYLQKVVYKKIKNIEELEYWKKLLFNELNLKIIQIDQIEMCRRNNNFSITFTTFVKKRKQEIKTIQDEGVNQYQEVNYEVVIITRINFKNKFQHITTYPVCDADGERPVTNYDTEDVHYKRLCAQHDKLQNLLGVMYNTYLNDCIIDDQKSLLLYNLLNLKCISFGRYVKMTDAIELKDSDIAIHDQNIEFIKKLQLEFGENITIEL
ncbi:hypothetical protein BDAP_002429 [Binucleata daphniae]